MTKIESVPGVLVAASPWARLPNSFPKARDHMCCVMGSSMSFLYFVMDSPVTGCRTGAQKCSPVPGMACNVGVAAYVCMLSADRAALEYKRGTWSAIRGDLRGAADSCVLVGSSVGGGASVGAGCAVGIVMGSLIGGMLFRVCRWCIRGAVRVIWGAVGFDDVGACCAPFVSDSLPFDVGHGSVAGS